MPLNAPQKHLIVTIDKRVKTILAKGGNEKNILVEMLDLMPGIKALMDSALKKEIDMYFYEYEGFYRYIKILEHLAQGLAEGHIKRQPT